MAKDFQQKMLSNLELSEFFNQLGMILRSGISATEGLHLLLEDAQTTDERALLQKMIEVIETTGYLHEAASSSGVFPNYAVYMIQLGEETGTLDEVMNGLSEHYTREENLAGMIRSSLIYPSIMLGMMALVIGVLLTKVLPIFQQVFEQLGQEMTGFSAGLLNIGKTLSNYFVVFVVLGILLVLFIIFGRKHLPFYKRLQNDTSACQFADGMSIALKSGLTPEQGIELVSKLIENAEFQKKITACQQKLEDGTDFSSALHTCEIFTGTYARMASIAGKAGTMDEAMAKISAEYEYNVNTRINHLIGLLEPTLVIVLSAIVGVILFSVMLPLLGIMSAF